MDKKAEAALKAARNWGPQYGTAYSELEKLDIINMYQAGVDWSRISFKAGRSELAVKNVVYGLRSAKRAESILSSVNLDYNRRRRKK